MMDRRPKDVWVTGYGVVSSIGTGKHAFTAGLRTGRDGVRPLDVFDASAYRRSLGAEVVTDWSQTPMADDVRCFELARRAVSEALQSSGIIDCSGAGLCVGTSAGEALAIERRDFVAARNSPPGVRLNRAHSRASSHATVANRLASTFGIGGPMATVSTACTASAHAICRAGDFIRHGQTLACVAGGVEILNESVYAGFSSVRSLTASVCRPFDQNRDGLELGEGAAFFVLEHPESAAARGVTAVAVLRGYGLANDAHHPTAPHPDGRGLSHAMRMALADADASPRDVAYVNAHGTGTPLNDLAEIAAVQAVLGTRAKSVPISSTKSMIGHTIGAAGALELAACIAAIQGGFLPPTIHLESPLPGGWDFVPQPRNWRPGPVLSNSAAFGGFCACLALVPPEMPNAPTGAGPQNPIEAEDDCSLR